MTKQFPLRFPLDLYRRVSAAAGVACTPMSKWIFDACEAKLRAMPVQLPERLMERNPIEAHPDRYYIPADETDFDNTPAPHPPAPPILRPLF